MTLTQHSHPRLNASFSVQKGKVCAVLTADCLPVLLCDQSGTMVAAIHAGWRGLCDGIIETSITKLRHATGVKPSALLAWLGAAIGPSAFVVGNEVRAQFIAQDKQAEHAFEWRGGLWYGDLYALACQRLNRQGVSQIFGGGVDSDFCTYTDSERFFSFRRDGVTGRMATVIWLS